MRAMRGGGRGGAGIGRERETAKRVYNRTISYSNNAKHNNNFCCQQVSGTLFCVGPLMNDSVRNNYYCNYYYYGFRMTGHDGGGRSRLLRGSRILYL